MIPLPHTGIAIAMKSKGRSLGRSICGLPSTSGFSPDAREYPRDRLRPATSIDAHREIFAMHIPMATGALLIESRKVAWFVDGAAEFVGEDYRVQRNAEIVFMELRDDSFRIGNTREFQANDPFSVFHPDGQNPVPR